MEYGEKIAALRKSKGMTQAELGAELNVTFQAVSKWERGESLPDFATMSKISKLFGVPLEYFEEDFVEGSETAAAVAVPAAEEEKPKMLGVCKICGKVVNEGEEFQLKPAVICRECHDLKAAESEKIKKEAEAKAKEEKLKAERIAAYNKRRAKASRNRGLIAGGIAGAVMLVITIISLATDPSSVGDTLLGGVILIVTAFAFLSQMFWGGAVRTVCCQGGVLIGTPGVIFTFDLDGFIFLIGIKLLFALLKFLVLIITSLFLVAVAVIISPFTFVPALIRTSRECD